jgi:hypothetical protein
LILAHERKDVRALNEAARAIRHAAGELGADHMLQTESGLLPFAEGDRIYFLRNERGLGGVGVKNGTLATLTGIAGERLTVALDGETGAGTGAEIVFDLADYADIGHGYAATIHKNQGATVDQAHVLATLGMDRHLAYVAMSRHRHAARLHWSEEDFRSPEMLRDRLGRERTKDTTLDYEITESDPIAAFAERRGLDPLAPASEIVVRETVRPLATTKNAIQPGPVASSLQRAISTLHAIAAKQRERAGSIAAVTQAGRPGAEPAKPDGCGEEAIRILKEIPPPPKRPGHHVVIDPEPAPAPALPPPVDPAEAERQALYERGRETVRHWNEMAQAEFTTMKAQDWRAWRQAWDGLIAFAREIKHDAPLDRLLREHGRELGVAPGSTFELVVQSSEAEIVWALKQDLSPNARPSPSPSFGL